MLTVREATNGMCMVKCDEVDNLDDGVDKHNTVDSTWAMCRSTNVKKIFLFTKASGLKKDFFESGATRPPFLTRRGWVACPVA